MKYTRTAQYTIYVDDVQQTQTRLVDMVDVPSPLPSWAADNVAFLEKAFPTLSGFFEVHPAVENCAVVNGDGTHTNPDGGTVQIDGTVTYPEPE